MSKLLSATKLADQLGLHRNTIGKWKKKGMPCSMVNGRPYYRVEEVQEWIEQQTEEAK